MGFQVGNAAISNVQNVALVTRNHQLAVELETTTGAAVAAAGDGMLRRGTIMVPDGNGAWRPFVHGSDTLALDQVRIMMDDIKLNQGQQKTVAGYSEGFFRLSSLVDANPGLVAGDLTTAAGFHAAGADEVRMK